MRFLADESCDFAIVRALRSEGHDVLAIAEISPRIGDEQVLTLARDEKRVLLTEDTDFGELIFAEGLGSSGVILFRFSAAARTAIVAADRCDKSDRRGTLGTIHGGPAWAHQNRNA